MTASPSPHDQGRPHAPQDSAGDASLNAEPNGALLPEAPVKRITAAVCAVLLLGSLALPWWLTSYPLRNLTTELPGWRLITIGIGADEGAALTGFSAFGNILFGAAPTLPLIVLAGLLIARAVKPRAVHGSTIATWAVLELFAIGWLLLLGWARLNATLGIHPATWGVFIATVVTLFTGVAFWNWWRRGERHLIPKRARIRLRPSKYASAERVPASELFDADDEDGGDGLDPDRSIAGDSEADDSAMDAPGADEAR